MIFSTKLGRWLCLITLSIFIDQAQAQSIRLLAWNVFMLPPPIYFSKQKERTKLQINALKELADQNDVLVLTETFKSSYKRELLKHLTTLYPYSIIQKKKRGFFKFMPSGVMILSKFPLKMIGQKYYNKCTKADCFATKAALLVEVSIPDGPKIQVLGTHLQSGSSAKVVRVRSSQVEQVNELLTQFEQEGVAQIVAGDLNIDSQRGPEFENMRTLLGLEPLAPHMIMANTKAEKVECFGKEFSNHPKNIDHILVKRNGTKAYLSDERVLPIQVKFKSGRECDLSDHHPVQSLINL